jgi:hypothetical protein
MTLSSSAQYDARTFPFMRRPLKEQTHETEPEVSIPPALIIQDSQGNIWTLGFDMGTHWTTGEFEYDVVRAGPDTGMKPTKTGEMACRIEYRRGKVRIFGAAGWRSWTGRQFV